VNRQNVTLSLPKTLLRKAKMMAAGEGKSLSQFLKESLEQRVRRGSNYNRARARQLGLMEKGLSLGTKGHVSVTREDLHVRH